jgi:hypothetical protein
MTDRLAELGAIREEAEALLAQGADPERIAGILARCDQSERLADAVLASCLLLVALDNPAAFALLLLGLAVGDDIGSHGDVRARPAKLPAAPASAALSRDDVSAPPTVPLAAATLQWVGSLRPR